MTQGNALNGAGLDFEKLKSSGYFIEAIPLHDPAKKEELTHTWLHTSLFRIDAQPVSDIKDYYGEEVALYFAWAGHFVRSFFPLACLGVITQIAQAVIKYGTSFESDSSKLGDQVSETLNVVTATYAFVMHIFIATYTYSWARRQYNLAHQWGVIDLKPDLKAISKMHSHVDMATIKRWESMEAEVKDTATDYLRYMRWAVVSMQLVLLATILAGAATFAVALRIARDSFFPDPLTLQSTVLFAVFESARSMAFQVLGQWSLSVMEPLDSTVFLVQGAKEHWQDAKHSLFDLVNNNLCLIYISLTTAFGDPRDFSWPARCYMDDCMMDLQVNIWALLGSKVLLPIVFYLFWAQITFFTTHPNAHEAVQHTAKDTKAALNGKAGAHVRQGGRDAARHNLLSTDSAGDKERRTPKFVGVNAAYAQICPLIGMVVIYGVAAPASVALLLALIQVKIKYDSYVILTSTQRPKVRRAKDTGTCQAYLTVIMTMANLVIPTLLIFVFTDVSRSLLGHPECPVQFVCAIDAQGDLRYNATIAEYRWRVHASDSNKHWLTWTALVCLGLSVRVSMSVLCRNPSYFIRATVNEQRFVQLKQGVLVNVESTHQQEMNLEEFDITYKTERRGLDELRAEGKSLESFDDWARIRQTVRSGALKGPSW